LIENLIKALAANRISNRDEWHDWKRGHEDEIATYLDYARQPGTPRAVDLVAPHFHREFPLIGLNYTPAAGLGLPAGNWSAQLKRCRGIVFDRDARLVAQPFPKFFNWGEIDHNSTHPAEITEKLDGHLIIVFQYGDHVVLTTRGDFESPSGLLAQELLANLRLPLAFRHATIMCEFIHPETKVGVDYAGATRLVVIGATINSRDQPHAGLVAIADYLGLEVVPKLEMPFEELVTVPEQARTDKEGVVARWLDGTRFKFKYRGYIEERRQEKINQREERTAPRVLGHSRKRDSAIFPSSPWLRRPI
jgi:RNA ligase